MDEDESEFEREAVRRAPSLAAELWEFLLHNRKFWMIPILLVLFGLGVLVFAAGTGVAPFIYTLF